MLSIDSDGAVPLLQCSLYLVETEWKYSTRKKRLAGFLIISVFCWSIVPLFKFYKLLFQLILCWHFCSTPIVNFSFLYFAIRSWNTLMCFVQEFLHWVITKYYGVSICQNHTTSWYTNFFRINLKHLAKEKWTPYFKSNADLPAALFFAGLCRYWFIF